MRLYILDGDQSDAFTLSRFIQDNREPGGGLAPDEIDAIDALALGQSVTLGGGAAADFTITRVQ